MAQGSALLDVLIGLLQSMVVLLLASGVYVALAVRKADEPDPKSPASSRGHQAPRAVLPGR